MGKMVNWHIGTMGFAYKQWVGPFYPAGIAARSYLAYYSQMFDAVEIDSTFYGPPSADSVKRWKDITPAGFTFCLKTPRIISHDMRLVDAWGLMTAFLDTLRLLGDKLGVVLLQFPPDFTHDHFNTLMAFLKELPEDIRFAVEFRHRSWDTPGTATLLERYNICWAAADYIYLPRAIKRTADFLYLRFIGPRGRFAAKDREMVDRSVDLQQWHQKIEPHLAKLGDVHSFFNDDYSGHSPATCNRFKEIVGVEPKEIRPLQQGRLF
jgi:uncharacterized protein YecE (DUF72 family)